MESPLRLLLVYEEYGRYGTPMIARHLVGALRADVAVTIVAPDVATATWIAADRPDTDIVTVPPVTNWRDIRALWRYWRLLRRTRPHIVQLTLPTPSVGTRYLALVVRMARGVRCVGVEHMYGDRPRTRTRVVTRVTMSALDAHIAIGPTLARILERHYGLRKGAISAIPAAIPADVVVSPHRVAPAPVIGTVARLSHEKGLDVLLRALAGSPEVPLVIVGEGPLRADLEQLARDLGRHHTTTFVGYQARPEDFVAGFDVCVLPSRREGLGLVLLEAMRAGLPVVASIVGGIVDVVEDGVTGILVPPDDPGALGRALERLVADPELRARLGTAGRARMEAQFATARAAQAYEALYDELAPPSTRAPGAPVTT